MDYFLRYSPNHNERPAVPISMIVMHYTGMTSGEAALQHLCSAESCVSAHYLIEEDGRIIHMVEEDRRAWHAGVSYWRGCSNVNDISLGIEIVNPGHEHGYRPFPQEQMQAVLALTSDIVKRYDIEPRDIVGHSDIAPLRKCDPGEYFPWEWLASKGVGLWPNDNNIYNNDTPDDANLSQQLHDYGYEITGENDQLQAVITAFQRHFRPNLINGKWDNECQNKLNYLMAIVK